MTAEFAQKLRGGETVIGTMIMYVRTPGIVRMAAAAGLDYVMLDLQHSNLGLETVADMCEVGRGCGIAVLVRPSTVSIDSVNRLLDIGAHGLQFHEVESADQAAMSITAMRYPPAGTRGVATSGPGSDYHEGPISTQFLADANAARVAIVQIESKEALDNLDAILAVDGIDVVSVGRQDMSVSLGVAGQTSHPLVDAAVDRVIQACREHGLIFGAAPGSPSQIQQLADLGARFLTCGTDKAILAAAYRSFASVRPIAP
jgi:4-hydroxy-2-oxoheptanedioate aldolase